MINRHRPLDVFKAPLSGISLVEASAGTGKTYNITSLYVRAVLEMGLIPSQILVMTYTEAATAELKFRLRKRLRDALRAIQGSTPENDGFLKELLKQSYTDAEEKLKTAIDSFDEAAVFTIHGFCSRVLTEYSLQFDVSPNFELLTDESELLLDCVDDYWRSFVRKAGEDQDQLVLLDYLTDAGFGPNELESALDEVLTHSFAKIEPENLDTKKLNTLIPDLTAKFKEIKEHWKTEGEKLKEIYLSDHLKGNIYTAQTHERDWGIFTDWISRQQPQIAYSDRLEKFGTKISRSGKKSAPDIPVLELCKAVDEYRVIADRLKLLKPAFIKDSIEEVRSDFKRKKSESNLLIYSDLLESVNNGLINDNSGYLSYTLSAKYPIALVDEFQDTDPVQYGIFRQIYAGKKEKALFMIGDPKQAIYGFRGADIFTYLTAKEDAADAQSYSLGENYRSNSKMIKGVNELFGSSSSPFLIKGLSFNPAQFPADKKDDNYILDSSGNSINPMQSILLTDEDISNKGDYNEWIYETITNEIIELLSENYSLKGEKVREKDIAILIRKGHQGEELQSHLRDKGIKSVLRSRTGVFQTRESDELFTVLKAVQNISSESGIRAALATELLGYSAADIKELLDNESEWSKIVEKFIQVKESWDKKGVDTALSILFDLFDPLQKLASKKDAERRITNLMHISELLEKTERQERLYGKALLKWYYRKKDDESTEADDEQLRLESDEKLIQISTIHAAKGLQYPIVFCPFLWDSATNIKKGDIFKFYKDGKIHIDISQDVAHESKDDFKAIAERQEYAESVRLAYVALTRSASACYLLLPDHKEISKSAIAGILGGGDEENPFTFDRITEALRNCDHIELRDPVAAKTIEWDSDLGEETADLRTKEFSRHDLFNFPRMLSYSSLVEGKDHGENAHDYDSAHLYQEETVPEYNKYGFPKGATAGTCLHKIFEDIQFSSTENLTDAVTRNLEYYGFSETWEKPVINWVKAVLGHSLDQQEIKLSNLKEGDVLKEMEFFFPVSQIKADDLWKMIRGENIDSMDKELVHGFMKGFIDLTFRYKDNFYILDYKSNHLGENLDDYSSENLQKAVLDAGYDLQYHIYTLALHRYLSQQMSGYSYEQHFGGVMYLFLRGVEEGKPGTGVFFDKPEESLIHEMDQYFREGGSK